MGTPGDETSLGKVVRNLSAELDEVQSDTQSTTPSTTHETVVEKTAEQYQDMTVLSQLPEGFIQSIYSEGQKPTLEDLKVGKEEESLVSEPCTYFETLTPFQKQTKALINLDLPGPSGLQTPKTQKSHLSAIKHGPKRSKKTQGQQQTPKRQHVCSICQKSFQNSAKLSSHQQVHGCNNPFKCEHCKKSFSSKFKLVRHVLIHSDRKPFSCSVCERTFHRKDHLKNHIKVHSPSKKIYTCPKADCKKEYTSQLSYKKHSALHAAEEGSLECKICLKTFETKEAILFHLKIHAGSRAAKNPNEKKFNCDFCDRKFFTRKDVRRHLVVHTGMRDFLCQFCPQRFGRKDHLVRHIKKSHSKLQSGIETDVKIEPGIKLDQEVDVEDPNLLEFKSEPFEGKLDPQQYVPRPSTSSDFSELLFQEDFTRLNPMMPTESETLHTYLPHTSTQESNIKLEDPQIISTDPSNLLIGQEELLSDAPEGMTPEQIGEEILRLFESSGEDKNTPLPGFSQVFHPPS